MLEKNTELKQFPCVSRLLFPEQSVMESARNDLYITLDSLKTQRSSESLQLNLVIRDEHGNITKIGLSDEERKVGRENYDFYCFLIWPFIEASWLAAVSLMGLTPPRGQTEDIWIEQSKAQNSAQLVSSLLPSFAKRPLTL